MQIFHLKFENVVKSGNEVECNYAIQATSRSLNVQRIVNTIKIEILGSEKNSSEKNSEQLFGLLPHSTI